MPPPLLNPSAHPRQIVPPYTRAFFGAHVAPPERYGPLLGEAMLLQMMGGERVAVDGLHELLRGGIHILLVANGWRSDVSTIITRAKLADPMRSTLFTDESRDEDSERIRRSEGWRFRRSFRRGHGKRSVLVEGGLAIVPSSELDQGEFHWVHSLLVDADPLVDDFRFGLESVAGRSSVLAVMRAKVARKRRPFAAVLEDDDIVGGSLREFDLVLPLEPPPGDLRPGQPICALPEDEDELASEDARAWARVRREGPPARVPESTRVSLEAGLRKLVDKHRRWGSAGARRIWENRSEKTLMRLAAASARSWGKQEADAGDVRLALKLMDRSWHTLTTLRGEA